MYENSETKKTPIYYSEVESSDGIGFSSTRDQPKIEFLRQVEQGFVKCSACNKPIYLRHFQAQDSIPSLH